MNNIKDFAQERIDGEQPDTGRYHDCLANGWLKDQVKIDAWKAKAALLIIEQCHFPLVSAINFAEAAYGDIAGDIEGESPQDCVDAEIDAMRANI